MAISDVLVNILSKISFTNHARLNFTSIVCFIALPNKSANFCTISALCLLMHLIMLAHVRYISCGPQHTLTPYPPPPPLPTILPYRPLLLQTLNAGEGCRRDLAVQPSQIFRASLSWFDHHVVFCVFIMSYVRLARAPLESW